MNVLKTSPGRKIPPHTHQKLLTLCVEHLKAYDRAGGMFTPKQHLFVHLTAHMIFFGNPRHRSTWHDETLNKAIRSAAEN
eukprot:9102584-Pyramimonas_sp.AAC.1